MDQLMNSAQKKVEAMVDVLEARLHNAQEHVRILNSQYHNGDMSTEEFKKTLEKWEMEVVVSQVDLVILQSQKHQFIGEYIDDLQLQGKKAHGAAYIGSLIRRYRRPKHAKLTLFKSLDALAQERFRESVFSAYRQPDGSDKGGQLCCISGFEYEPYSMTAAHIVAYNVGEVQAEYLFGKPGSSEKDGHIMSARNGLPMLKMYEEMLDDGSMTLVPVPGTNDIQIVVFKALGPSALSSNKKLHGKLLSFRTGNDFRPAHPYLYFHYAMTLLRRQRHQAPGWWKGMAEYGSHVKWATPGQYLRQSTLISLAQKVGHLTALDAKLFVSPKGLLEARDAPDFDGPDDAGKDSLIAASVIMRTGSFGFRQVFFREKRGENRVWKFKNRPVSWEVEELEEIVIDDEDEGEESEGEWNYCIL